MDITKFEEISKKIDKQIKENNAHVTAMFRVSHKDGSKAAFEAQAKLTKLFKDLDINPSEWARRKLAQKVEANKRELLQKRIREKQRNGDMKMTGDLIKKARCFYAWIKDGSGYDTNEGYIFPAGNSFSFIKFDIGDANYKFYIS